MSKRDEFEVVLKQLKSKNKDDKLNAIIKLVKNGTIKELNDNNNAFKLTTTNTGDNKIQVCKIQHETRELPLKDKEQNIVNTLVSTIFNNKNTKDNNFISKNIKNASKYNEIKNQNINFQKHQDVKKVYNILNTEKGNLNEYNIVKYDNATLKANTKFDSQSVRSSIFCELKYNHQNFKDGAKIKKNGIEIRGGMPDKVFDKITQLAINNIEVKITPRESYELQKDNKTSNNNNPFITLCDESISKPPRSSLNQSTLLKMRYENNKNKYKNNEYTDKNTNNNMKYETNFFKTKLKPRSNDMGR